MERQKRRWLGRVLAVLAAAPGWAVSGGAALSEQDFLSDLPVVVSVSRLPQRLDETPGAVTVLDRDFIHASGARDLADLLRLVPGFQSSQSFEGDAPQASYHGAFGNYSARIQILIDGRSAYSTYLFGSVAPGLMSIALDDIERVEVLRGSNSAAYGARAMFGVVNVVTRHSADTLGTQLRVSRGGAGVQDSAAQLGWASAAGTWRLSLDQRQDDGLLNTYDFNRVRRANLRGDLQLGPQTELGLRAGWMEIDAGRGFASNPDAPTRDTGYDAQYLQLDWRRTLDADQDLLLSWAHNQEAFDDRAYYTLPAPYSALFGPIPLDYSGRSSSDTLTLQHTWRLNPRWRLVWGGEWRQERIESLGVYGRSDALRTDFTRWFANAEWRLHPQAVLNLGAMAEHSSHTGDTLAPRAMVSWHLAPGQTLRAGVARAFRPPSRLETDGNIRYQAVNRLTGVSQLLKVTLLPRGQVQPESVRTR